MTAGALAVLPGRAVAHGPARPDPGAHRVARGRGGVGRPATARRHRRAGCGAARSRPRPGPVAVAGPGRAGHRRAASGRGGGGHRRGGRCGGRPAGDPAGTNRAAAGLVVWRAGADAVVLDGAIRPLDALEATRRVGVRCPGLVDRRWAAAVRRTPPPPCCVAVRPPPQSPPAAWPAPAGSRSRPATRCAWAISSWSPTRTVPCGFARKRPRQAVRRWGLR